MAIVGQHSPELLLEILLQNTKVYVSDTLVSIGL